MPVSPGALFTETHVLLLRAIGILQLQGIRSIKELRFRLHAMSPEQLRSFVEDEDDDEGNAAEGQASDPAAPVGAPHEAQVLAEAAAEAAGAQRQEWERVVLALGLELHLRKDAGDDVRRKAEEIIAQMR